MPSSRDFWPAGPRHGAPQAQDDPSSRTLARLSELRAKIKTAKAADLAAKRARNWKARPALGLSIYNLVRELNTLQEANRG